MSKIFKIAHIRELERMVHSEEISYSRMVEMLNEIAFKHFLVVNGGDSILKRYIVSASDGCNTKSCIVMATTKKEAWQVARKIICATYGEWEYRVNMV